MSLCHLANVFDFILHQDAKKADVFVKESSLGSEKLVTNAFVCKVYFIFFIDLKS